MKTEQKRIITYGTFDMFHIGHLNLLKRLKSMADTVIVAVSTDAFNLEKNKKTIIPFEQRIKIVKSVKYVDMVIPEESWEQKTSDIKEYDIDIFAIGRDWEGKFDFLKDYCRVVYLERTKGISSTEIKKSLKSLLSIPQEDLRKAFDILEILRKDLQ
ncbi:MAG: glycerol-3-phosphate cytidylyltransferase [Spirochaetes bacterium]|jgi:glycerol-3-phosphate cytidylyltransferase|nr:glycerol-3-phosphate cytidylyltransferase [Spirochaetota bacterium]